ncbi:MAG: hypothetical protein AB1Z51_09245 [Desulfuromonadales bacterium]
MSENRVVTTSNSRIEAENHAKGNPFIGVGDNFIQRFELMPGFLHRLS